MFDTLTYQEKELIAKEWIRDNTHVALTECVKAHQRFMCKCIFEDIIPMVIRMYPSSFTLDNK